MRHPQSSPALRVHNKMAAKQLSVVKELYDMTECSICTEMFTDPRVLPCQHTFCLKCLVNYGRDRPPGDDMPCPLCRKEFVIPDDGLSGMQKNFFMEKLLSARERSAGEEVGHIAAACDTHKDKEIVMFCLKCELAICVKCFVESHKTHDCSDIEEVSMDRSKQVKSDTDKIIELLKKIGGVLSRFEKEKNDLVSRLADIEGEINTTADRLIATIERERVKLLSEVESIKLKRVKQLETVKQEVEQHMAAMESLKQYSELLLSSGTACDVTRSAKSLHSRAEELKMFDVISHVDSSLSSVNVTFTSSSLPCVENLVGTVTEGL